MAYAAAKFCESLLEALNEGEGKVECAYVDSSMIKGGVGGDLKYFAVPCLLGVSIKFFSMRQSKSSFFGNCPAQVAQ